MAIFQKSIVDKYLLTLDEGLIESAVDTYKSVYIPQIHRIRALKEEQYQSGFLQDIFGSVLGYTIDPKPGYNIEVEKKNESNSKKADGASVDKGKVLAVIELKSNKNKKLDSIKDQAFGYKNNHKGCNYVISSNFHKLRFYVDDATEYEEFDLYNLDKESFKRFYLYLRKEGLLDKNLPKLLKEQTKFHEEKISKDLYRDYSAFKNKFFENIVKNNPQYDKLLLFKKSQKFLDRILFILFAEDKNLIPTNAISRVVESWALADDLQYKPLYDLFKILFTHLNEGHVYKSGYEIPAYGGGLFTPDPLLDTIKVDDDILKDDLLILSKYDYNTDVDVNILGHIFEHSLSEIEEIEAKLKGEDVDKSKGKRKKDGVFYTPKYITKYIVDNTVGKLCVEKKSILELYQDFDIVEYQKSSGGVNKKGEKLFHTLESYKKWLLELKIVDPACGSGAFLNEALSFLIKEHKEVDDLIAELTNTPLRIFDTEKSILENNIYGVDINEESVEIAKLSMWLRTAQKGRQLSDLSNNIKCGNSLINDITVAGDKAFNWENEFPQVFSNGGFDVVIGNPPYVRKQGLMEHYPEMCDYYDNTFVSATGNYDIYALFMEKSFSLINIKGVVSFILPHKFLVSDFGEGIRTFFKENTAVENLVHFGSELVFKDAATYTCIVDLTKTSKEKVNFKKVNPENLSESFVWDTMSYSNLSIINWDLQSEKVFDIIEKLKIQPYTVDNVFESVFQGIATSLDAVYVFHGQDKGDYIKAYNSKYDYCFEIEKDLVKPFIKGNEISKYKSLNNKYFVFFPYINGEEVSEEYIKNKLPKTYAFLKHFEKDIRGRERGKMDIEEGWFLYIYPKSLTKFGVTKIMTQEISLGCNMTYDEKGEFYHPTTIYSFVKNERFNVDDKFYLGILNSRVMWFFLKNTGTELGGGYFRFKTNYLKPFPLPEISENSDLMIDNVNQILSSNKNLQEVSSKFQRTLQRKFEGLEKLPKKLENWYELTFADFIKELKKKKIVLSFEEETRWEDYFLPEQQKALEIKSQINQTDKEIDTMVYELYDLTDEEIAIIEND